MKVKQPILLDVLASIAADLSAAWIAAIFIVPNFLNRPLPDTILLLILNGIFATLFAGLAYLLKNKVETL